MTDPALVHAYLAARPEPEYRNLPREAVAFLARGEYNENFLVRTQDGPLVLRINHGSQLGLGAEQILYEYKVLQAVAPSGVTPRPRFVDASPARLPGGCLAMDFLPGTPLVYERDLDKAGRTFAAVHAVAPASGDGFIIDQPDPIRAIAEESLELLTRQPDHPMPEKRERLLAYREEVLALADEHGEAVAADLAVLVNTEVNSGNFLVADTTCFLVDWEKAVRSSRYQDLGHFVVPTTTLWKTDTRLTREQKRVFLTTYLNELERLGALPPGLDLETAEALTAVLEKTILLRGLSWCFMAYREYAHGGRAIANQDTYQTIIRYLDELECFLG